MYLLNDGHIYYRGTRQCWRRGLFLILMDTAEETALRAIVRKVALQQRGHWMMGRTRIGKYWYTLSGAYGSDGLPLTVKPDAYARGVLVPKHLVDAWKKGGGWNSAGREVSAMRDWALKTFCPGRQRQIP